MQLIYHPDVETELVESARFYEQRRANLGQEFLDAVESVIQKILKSPLQWRVIEFDVRSCLLSRFPFAVYFRVDAEQIRILSIKHHSRHPDIWRERSTD